MSTRVLSARRTRGSPPAGPSSSPGPAPEARSAPRADPPAPAAAPAARSGPARTGPTDIVLIGGGEIARAAFGPALRRLEERKALHVRCVIEPDAAARAALHAEFPGALALSSLDSAVAPPDSLAIVASAPRFHAAHAAAAFKRGWHVFAASPLAPSAAEAETIVAASRRHERVLAVDLPRRFAPAAHYLRTLCRDHLLGPPISVRIQEGVPRAAPAGAAPREKFDPPDGVLTDVGHDVLDLLAWCLGPGTVKRYVDDAMGGAEANAFVELAFTEGATATVQLTREWHSEQLYTFVFERGIVRWQSRHPAALTLHLASAPAALHGTLGAPLSPLAGFREPPQVAEDPRLEALSHVLGALARRERLRLSGAEALPALAFIDACYARRDALAQPWLPPTEAVQARAFAPPKALRRP